MLDHTNSSRTRVQLCGALTAEIGGRRVDPLLPGRKGRQLFACLVVSRSRPMSRDELIEIIWPDDAPADPDGTLSTLLTRLRTAVGRELVRGRSELVLELGADAWIDWEVAAASIAGAETRLAAGDARGALEVATAGLEIARRPLLPGGATPWIEDRRRELAETRAALLETSGRAALALAGEHLPTAERSARELIEREPYRESGYALLMETHAARGNVAEALRVYDDCRRLLREELGLIPAPALTALAGRLLEQGSEPSEPALVDRPPELPATIVAAARRPLAGRHAQLRRLVTAVIEASSDRCRVVAVTGEAGIGKSRLAAEVALQACDTGCEVLHGHARRGAASTLHAFLDALRGHLAGREELARELLPVLAPELAELARFVPELRTAVEPAPDETGADSALRLQRACEGAQALLCAVARRNPVLLVLEDLQWSDSATLLLLRRLAHAFEARITVLVTLRDDASQPAELRDTLLDLHRAGALERVALEELDPDETAELVGDRAADVEALRAQAGGNPFYLEELLRGSAVDLRAAVESRLDPLPASLRDTLAASAAVGRAFDVGTVARHAGAPRAVVADALAHAARIGLLVADGTSGRFAFRHGLVWHALTAAA